MYNPQIYTFVKVVESKSFSKAADALYLSRVSVMRQINALEGRVGTKLLIRSSSGIRLTAAGESFYRDALDILERSETAICKARRIGGSERHIIRVGTSPLNPCQPLIAMWDEVRSDYPHLRVKVVAYSDEHTQILDVMSSLGEGFDLAMAIHDSKDWGKVTSFLPVDNQPIQCAVPISHPLASRDHLEIIDFDGQRLMMVSDGDSPGNARARRILLEKCPNIEIMDVGNYYDTNVFHDCVEENCLLLSLPIWKDIHPSLVTIPVIWDCSIPHGILYPRSPSPQVREFIDIIRRYLGI